MARIQWLASTQPDQKQLIRYGVRSTIFSASFSFEQQPLTPQTFASNANGHVSVFMKKWLYAIHSEASLKFFTAQVEQAPKFLKSGRWAIQDGALEHKTLGQTKTLMSASELAASPSFIGLPEIPFALMKALSSANADDVIYGAFFPVTDKVFAFCAAALEPGRYGGRIADVTQGFNESAFTKIEWQKRSAFEFTWNFEKKLITEVILRIPTLGSIKVALIP